MKLSLRRTFCAFFTGLMLWAAPASAGVTITPNTLVIEGRERYADVTLINAGDKPNTYEMGWRFFHQEENTGKYINSDQPTTDFDISQNMIFTPRRITLMPGKAQKVRLGLRLKGDAPPPGDYRGHFELKEVSDQENLPVDPKIPQVAVNIKVGFTIPVIYRVGESTATATMGQVRTQLNKAGKIEAIVPLIKSNDPYAILGHLAVYHQPGNGAEVKIGSISNANIFPEITKRTFTIPLKTNDLKQGSLRIVYRDRQEDKNLIYAEKIIRIGN